MTAKRTEKDELYGVEDRSPVDLLREQEERRKFFRMPSSQHFHTISQVMASSSTILQNKAIEGGKDEEWKIETAKGGTLFRITRKSKNSETSIIIKLPGLAKAAAPTRKYFRFILAQIAENYDFSAKQFKVKEISFTLQSIVDIGGYKNINTARDALKKAAGQLMSMKVYAAHDVIVKGKKAHTESITAVLFPTIHRVNDAYIVSLNPDVSWNMLLTTFTYFPKWGFSLPMRAMDLLAHIFFTARQNYKQLMERGYFIIKMRTVHRILALPSEKGNREPKKTIKDPIEKAISDIEDTIAANREEIAPHSFLRITPIYNESGGIMEYLDKGYLKIEMGGEYLEPFLKIAKNWKDKLKKAEASRERVIEKAKADALSKKLEAPKNSL